MSYKLNFHLDLDLHFQSLGSQVPMYTSPGKKKAMREGQLLTVLVDKVENIGEVHLVAFGACSK